MSLALTVISLLVLAIYALIKKLTPPDTPIEDIDEHMKHVMQCSNQDQRRKYIKTDAKRRRKKSE